MGKWIRGNHAKMCGIVIIGSFCHFLLSLLFATVIFNKSITNTSSSDPEIEMVMQLQPMEQHVDIWMESILPLHITVEIGNISKLDEDCKNPRPGSLTDLIPITGPVCGSASTVMKIAIADRNEMPNFEELSHDVMPMAYIREETMARVRPMIKFAAVMLKRLSLICWTVVLMGISLVLIGGFRIYSQKKCGAT